MSVRPKETIIQKEMYLHRNTILGAFAKWITRQSPKIENIAPLLQIVDGELAIREEGHGVTKFQNKSHLKSFLYDLIFTTPIKELNVSEWSRKSGTEQGNVYVSRYFYPKPEYDFVDLDALLRNIFDELVGEEETINRIAEQV